MKYYGILILLAGLLLGGYALNMKVSVDVEARDFGYGIRTPAMEVANVNLMEQRQNLLIFAGVLAVVGAILTGFGSMSPKASQETPQVQQIADEMTTGDDRIVFHDGAYLIGDIGFDKLEDAKAYADLVALSSRRS